MSPDPLPYVIGIPIYPGVDVMDVTEAVEVFGRMRDRWTERRVKVRVLGRSRMPVRTRDGLRLVPQNTFREVSRMDLLWVPGGDPNELARLTKNERFLQRLRHWSEGAEYVTSVCEGALLLAAAGLLDGHAATTHWEFLECLREYPDVEVVGGNGVYPRFVVSPDDESTPPRGVRVTGAGISAGIDEALELVRRIAGLDVARDVRCALQYFPDPPVDAALPDDPYPCAMPQGWSP